MEERQKAKKLTNITLAVGGAALLTYLGYCYSIAHQCNYQSFSQLGVGENDTINGIIPPTVIDWAIHEPTPQEYLEPGEMDNFWNNQWELTGGEFQLEPNNF